MLPIKLSPKAYDDLVLILVYTKKEYGEAQTNKYKNLILSGINLIGKMPYIGHTRIDLPSSFLAYSVGQHILIYKIREGQNEVTIIRILHSRMDFTSRF